VFFWTNLQEVKGLCAFPVTAQQPHEDCFCCMSCSY